MIKSAVLLSVFMFAAALAQIISPGMAFGSSSGELILLRRATIDTGAAARTMSGDASAAQAAGNEFYILQFDGAIQQGWKDELGSLGVRFFSYIPNNAFIVKMSPNTVDFALAHDHVRYVGPYEGSYKIDPGLDKLVPLNAGAARPQMSGSYPTVELKVKVFDSEKVGPVVKAVEGLGGTAEVLTDREGLNKKFIKATVSADALGEVAAIPQVEWVERFPYISFQNYYGTLIMGVDALQDPVFYGLDLPIPIDGRGQTVTALDSGLDTGNMATLNNYFNGLTPDGKPKVKSATSFRSDNSWSDITGHGTHVAATMAGIDPSNPDFAGVATGAQLYFQSAQSFAEYFLTPPMEEVFLDSVKKKSFLHNDSWITLGGAVGEYNSQCVEIDTFTWEHQNFLPVFPAGNEGRDVLPDPFNNDTAFIKADMPDGFIDTGSIMPPSTSKNVIAVGAAENFQDFVYTYGDLSNDDADFRFPNTTSLWPREPIISDDMNEGPIFGGLAAYSGRGPTLDNRIKPDLVAPGTHVYSSASQVMPPGPGFIGPSDLSLGLGTSYATPFVTGSAALVRQYLRICGEKNPSAALIKALLINGAYDMSPGQYGFGLVDPDSNTWVRREIFSRPDVNQGWGFVDPVYSIFPNQVVPDRYVVYRDVDRDGIKTGLGQSYTFYVTDPTQPVRVTLVWTDYPSTAAATKTLVNDLDLTVYTTGGDAMRGNDLDSVDVNLPAQWDEEGISYDHVNNVEGVEFMPIFDGPGYMYVEIQGFNVPQGKNGQTFALVVSGGLGNDPAGLLTQFFSMSGTVFNKLTKLPSAGATVTALGPVVAKTTADGAGNFTFSNLLPGTYYLYAEGTLGETNAKVAKKSFKNGNITGVKVFVQ